MKDLFDVFPDLPWPAKHVTPVSVRVQSVRNRAAEMRRRMEISVDERRRLAAKVREVWRRGVEARMKGRRR